MILIWFRIPLINSLFPASLTLIKFGYSASAFSSLLLTTRLIFAPKTERSSTALAIVYRSVSLPKLSPAFIKIAYPLALQC